MSTTMGAARTPSPRPDGVLARLVAILEDMTQDWDTGLRGRIDGHTRLMADLGFASIDLVALISAVDEEWQRRDWPYERLLMEDGRYVEDLTVDEIATFLSSQGAR
jgi:acyl carrier protein